MWKVAGASLVMVSLIEFVWFTTTSWSENVSNERVFPEDEAAQPMPVDLLAVLIQMLTFVSCQVFIVLDLVSESLSLWLTSCSVSD